MIESLRAWYPSLATTEDRSLLTHAFYDARVALAGEVQDAMARPTHVLLLEAESSCVGYLAVEYDAFGRVMLGRLSVVDPRCRGRGLGSALARASVVMTRLMCVQMIYGLVELDNRAQCASLERAGHLLCGIAPDSDRKPVGPSTTRYVPEAVYVNLLVPRDALAWPPAASLRPATAVLMAQLFERGEPRAPTGSTDPASPPTLGAEAEALCAARSPGIWPDIRWFAPELGLPTAVVPRALARSDVPELIAALPEIDAQLADTPDHHLLQPSFYDEHVALAGEDADIERRPVYAWVVEREGRIETFHHATYDGDRSTLTGRFSTLAVRHPGAGDHTLLPRWLSLMGRLLGVETVLCWTDLRDPSGQLACELCGFRLFGFFPASDRISIAPGEVRHGFHAIYGISLVSPEQSHVPDRSTMSPRVAALADFVLGPCSDP